MNLRIRYEDKYQTLSLDTEAVGKLWVSLGLEDGNYTDEEKEQLMQEAWEEQYNRPDYNCWHKYWRHHGDSKAESDEDDEQQESSGPLMKEVSDDRIFKKDEIERAAREDDEAICQWIRNVLYKKPETAEAFIATKYNDMTIRDYAASIAKLGDDIAKLENNLSKKLTRAAKTLAEAYPGRNF